MLCGILRNSHLRSPIPLLYDWYAPKLRHRNQYRHTIRRFRTMVYSFRHLVRVECGCGSERELDCKSDHNKTCMGCLETHEEINMVKLSIWLNIDWLIFCPFMYVKLGYIRLYCILDDYCFANLRLCLFQLCEKCMPLCANVLSSTTWE